MHLPGESDRATKWSSGFMADEPHCSLSHAKPLAHQCTPQAATEEERSPPFSDGFLTEARGSFIRAAFGPTTSRCGSAGKLAPSGVTKASESVLANTGHKRLLRSRTRNPENLCFPSNPSTCFLYIPLPGWWPTRIKIPHSPSDAPLRGSPTARPSRLPSRRAQLHFRRRGGDNGSGAGGAGRQLTGVCGFASWPLSRPAWARRGAGEPVAAGSRSWRAEREPVRGAAEAQHVSGDGVQREASLPAGRDGYDGRALRGGSRRVFGEWQARGSGSGVGGRRSGCPPAARSSPRKKGAQRRGGAAAPVSARAEREMGAGGVAGERGSLDTRSGREEAWEAGAWGDECGMDARWRGLARARRGESRAPGWTGPSRRWAPRVIFSGPPAIGTPRGCPWFVITPLVTGSGAHLPARSPLHWRRPADVLF